MKKIKTLSAIVICICLIASIFAGCSKTSLEGKWVYSVDLTEEFSERCDMTGDAEIGQYYEEINIPLFIDIIYTFDSDNNYTCAVDEEMFNANLNGVIEEYVDYVLEGMYKSAEAEGMSRDEFDSFYEEENRIPLYEAVRFEADAKLNAILYEIIDGFTVDSPQHFIIKDDRFYLPDDDGNEIGYLTFILERDILTITGEYDMQDMPLNEDEFPIIMTKMAE